MAVTIGWWAVPALITVVSLGYTTLWPSNGNGVGYAVQCLVQFMAAVIVSLMAWLIWALLV